ALRESSGNPHAINNWDINAQKGIPSKGLLQVIPPTFATYHVAGTSKNIYNPVANIVAACNYAAHRYGSMDNVNSAY
ncbi:transglycosylase SLT domain-containing protein, partial [Streptantibioticus silvisoli]